MDIASAEALWVGVWRRLGALGRAAVIARSNGLEHLNYHRMLDDHREGLLRKPWTRRWFHPAVRLTQVAAAARAADRLLLLNDADRDFALNRVGRPRPRSMSFHTASRLNSWQPRPSRDEPRGRGILFCGSWTAVKGVSHLAAAFSRLLADGLRTNLTVLGGAVPDDVIRSAFSVDARPHVTILARMSERDVMAAYRSHDVLVWPSTYEGFGMVVIEAMSQRLPVVATPVGCARNLITHERTGLLVVPRSPDALAAALRRLLEDRALRLRLADAAFEQVREMTWGRTAHQTLACYARALQNNGHAAA